MASRQAKRNTRIERRQRSLPKDEGKRPQGINKERPHIDPRQSTRLEGSRLEGTVSKVLSRTSNTLSEEFKRTPPVSQSTASHHRKRKRPRNPSPKRTPEDERSRKRQRSSPEGRRIEEHTCDIKNGDADPVIRWLRGKPWPKEYFEQENIMNPLLKRKTSSSSLSKKSETSDGSLREGKNPAVKSRLYEKSLAAAGIYMGGGPGITDACRALCKVLLEAEQPLPPDSIFRDDRFEKTCERLRNENEAKVIRDMSPLLVPSVEVLCSYGEEHLESMVDHVNQKWYGCIPIVAGPVPQPDYCAGCKEAIFTKGQRRKLEPFIKGWKRTPFLATAWMYFPFFTMEVKCGNEGLNIADRQNGHSSGVAVKQVVDLYREVSRQDELNRKILAFSISHDQEAVRVYGHYPVIDEDQTSIYRHTIKKFDITSEEGRDKWTTYTFTRNLYDIYAPIHFERLRSAAEQLPCPLSDQHQSQQSDLGLISQHEEECQFDLVLSQDPQCNPSSQTFQPSFKKPRSEQGLQSQCLSPQSSYAASLQEEAESQSSSAPSRDITPDTSLPQDIESGLKKPPKRGRIVELHQ